MTFQSGLQNLALFFDFQCANLSTEVGKTEALAEKDCTRELRNSFGTHPWYFLSFESFGVDFECYLNYRS